MTIFGIVWCALLVECLIISNMEGLIFLTLLSSTLQCNNVFVIGNVSIGPQVVTSIVFLIKMIVNKRNFKVKIRRNAIGIQTCVITLFFITFFSSILNNCIEKNFMRVVQLLIYLLCFLFMYDAGEKVRPEYVYSSLRRITIFLLIVGGVQLLITTGWLPRMSLIKEFIYNDSSSTVYFYHDNYFRVMSTYMEPSYFAGFLVGSFYYFLLYKTKRKENLVLLIAILSEIIFTFSSTAYGAFLLMGFVIIVASKDGKFRACILISGIVGFFVMYLGFYNILDTVIFSKMETGSGITRLYWNRAAQRAFESSPIYGVGYKMSRASSLFYTLLAETGILGLATYLFVNLQIILQVFSRRTQNYDSGYQGICIAVISVVVCQMIAIPDLDICTYWMWMNFLALSYAHRKEKKNEGKKYNIPTMVAGNGKCAGYCKSMP